jgi:hypothetical protein
MASSKHAAMCGFGERRDVARDRLVAISGQAESDLLHVHAERSANLD